MDIPKYDWDYWLSQPITVLVRGVDYDVPQASMVQQARNAAHKRQVRLSVADKDDRIVLTCNPRAGSVSTLGCQEELLPSETDQLARGECLEQTTSCGT